jgi:hypothetical protein
MEVVKDLAYPLPANVIAEMLGMPTSDRELLQPQGVTVCSHDDLRSVQNNLVGDDGGVPVELDPRRQPQRLGQYLSGQLAIDRTILPQFLDAGQGWGQRGAPVGADHVVLVEQVRKPRAGVRLRESRRTGHRQHHSQEPDAPPCPHPIPTRAAHGELLLRADNRGATVTEDRPRAID